MQSAAFQGIIGITSSTSAPPLCKNSLKSHKNPGKQHLLFSITGVKYLEHSQQFPRGDEQHKDSFVPRKREGKKGAVTQNPRVNKDNKVHFRGGNFPLLH